MKRYAVALVSLVDNVLELKVVIAKDGWRNALAAAFPSYGGYLESESLTAAQEEAFNQDWLFDVVEIEDN